MAGPAAGPGCSALPVGLQYRGNPQINAFVASQTALDRADLPDDIGGVIAALLSPGTGSINAQRIEASGGMFV